MEGCLLTPPPPPHGPIPLECTETSVVDLCDGLYFGGRQIIILDSDGDHFLFSPIFNWTPVSRDFDCFSLVNIRDGRSQLLWTLPSQTVRRCFRECANILSMRDFYQCEISVDASILSTRVFCWRQHFVDTSILSTPTLCRRQHFVEANIFVTANILSLTNILSVPIFCLRLGLRMIIYY